MMLLWNSHRILWESLQIAVTRMASVLKIPRSAIAVRLDLSGGGGLSPEFRIDVSAAHGVTDDDVRGVIEAVWVQELRPRMAEQLREMGERWRPYGVGR
jgi:hypothetical protein